MYSVLITIVVKYKKYGSKINQRFQILNQIETFPVTTKFSEKMINITIYLNL